MKPCGKTLFSRTAPRRITVNSAALSSSCPTYFIFPLWQYLDHKSPFSLLPQTWVTPQTQASMFSGEKVLQKLDEKFKRKYLILSFRIVSCSQECLKMWDLEMFFIMQTLEKTLHCFGKQRVITSYWKKRHMDPWYSLKSLKVDASKWGLTVLQNSKTANRTLNNSSKTNRFRNETFT